MNKLISLLKRLMNTLWMSIRRFPETITTSVAFVTIMIINNRLDYDPNQILNKVALVLALGIPISSCLTLLIERMKLSKVYRYLFVFALLGYGIVFYLFIPTELNQRFMIRYAFVTTMFYLIFSLIPYFYKRSQYGLYLVKLVTTFFITYLYTLVLYLGLIAIIFTVDFLFNLNIRDKIYFDMFMIAVGVFGLIFYLGRVPRIEDDITNYSYPTVLRVLLASIVIPIISVYTLVLHAYLLRIIFFVGWSSSFVSNLVIWYGFVSIILLMLIAPLEETKIFIRKFRIYYPFAMVIPMIMLIISIIIRINTYGGTELRYLGFTAWIWFIISIVYLIIDRKSINQFLSLSFILVFAIALFNPFNVFSLGIKSQIKRLELSLEKNDILVNQQLRPNKDVSDDERINISSQIDYLLEYDAIGEVQGFDKDFTREKMTETLGFEYGLYNYGNRFENNQFIDYYTNAVNMERISDFDYHILVNAFNDQSSQAILEDIQFNTQDFKLTISKNNVDIWTQDLNELLNPYVDQFRNSSISKIEMNDGPNPILIDIQEETINGKIYIKQVNGQVTKDKLSLDSFTGDIYFRINE